MLFVGKNSDFKSNDLDISLIEMLKSIRHLIKNSSNIYVGDRVA